MRKFNVFEHNGQNLLFFYFVVQFGVFIAVAPNYNIFSRKFSSYPSVELLNEFFN